MKKWLLISAVLAGAALLLAARLQAQTNNTPHPHPLHPAQPGLPVHGGKPVMNSYGLKDFSDFIKQWHFVTVRYRKDTGEMRLTYANDKAWEALMGGGKKYPDGAVFAKIGIMTKDDPGFVSSVVPSGAKRYQLMVMDHTKHKNTDGWGYALFDAGGLTFEQDPKEQVAACHACHQLVRERDYVFSEPMHLDVGMPSSLETTESDPLPKIIFVTKKTQHLPQKLQTVIPLGFKKVRVIEHDISRNLFQGTIDEIRPTLSKEARRAKTPAVLVNEAGTRFSMVIAKKKAEPCTLGDGGKGVEMMAIYTIKPGPADVYPIQNLTWCEEAPAPSVEHP